MPTYNHAFSLGFSVPHSNCPTGESVTAEDLRVALQKRLQDLNDVDLLEACGMPLETHEEEPGFKVYVLHAKTQWDRENIEFQKYLSINPVGCMTFHQPINDGDALETAWRYTNNVDGSWSMKIGSDAHNDMEVLADLIVRNGQTFGLRSSMVNDLFGIAREDSDEIEWHRVADLGFEAVDANKPLHGPDAIILPKTEDDVRAICQKQDNDPLVDTLNTNTQLKQSF